MGWPAVGGEATKAAAGKDTRGAALHTHMVGGLGHFFFSSLSVFPNKKMKREKQIKWSKWDDVVMSFLQGCGRPMECGMGHLTRRSFGPKPNKVKIISLSVN